MHKKNPPDRVERVGKSTSKEGSRRPKTGGHLALQGRTASSEGKRKKNLSYTVVQFLGEESAAGTTGHPLGWKNLEWGKG